jgi:hypothetical protein
LFAPDSDHPLGVAGSADYLTYSSRGAAPSDGHPPRRVHVSKRAADAFVVRTIVEALDGQTFDLFASTRLVEDAKRQLEAAEAEHAGVLAKAGILTVEELEAAIVPARAKREAARDAYDRALAEAEEAVDLPKDGAAFLALDELGKRRVACSLIGRIVVSPPVAAGTIEDRFRVVWANGG